MLYKFTGNADGCDPLARLTFDAAGNLYGTTSGGGHYGKGIVFKLMPNASGNWGAYVLHNFTGPDGNDPEAGLIIDAAGNLYGTTFLDGAGGGGVVFEIAAGTSK